MILRTVSYVRGDSIDGNRPVTEPREREGALESRDPIFQIGKSFCGRGRGAARTPKTC